MATIKTAVSIDEALFERAEALANELEVSRSRIFALALEQLLKRHQGKKLLERLNSVYETAGAERTEARIRNARRAMHRALVRGTW